MTESVHPPLQTSLARFTRLALISAGLFAMLVIAACLLIKISGAVQASGVIIANGQNRILQHPDGGQIVEVLVRDGDEVVAGEPLLRLEGTELRAEDARLKRRKLELEIQLNRLNAAIEGKSQFVSSVIRGRYGEQTEAGKIEDLQSSALAAERALLNAEVSAAMAQARGAETSLETLRTQRATNTDRLSLIDSEIDMLRELVADKLVSQNRLTRLEREKLDTLQREQSLRLEESRLKNLAKDARNTASTIRRRADDRLWKNREEATRNLADITRQLEQISAKLSRLEISAPISGRVHELAAQNPGITLAPGDMALQIVPMGSVHDVRIRIPATEIDDVSLGQPARVRFDTYRDLMMPELSGVITRLGADRSIDAATGQPYFSAIVSFAPEHAEELSTISPETGLPVTVLITTQQRSLASYLIAPARDAFARTFTEN